MLQPASQAAIFFFCLVFRAPADLGEFLAGMRATDGVYVSRASRASSLLQPFGAQTVAGHSLVIGWYAVAARTLVYVIASQVAAVWCRSILSEASNVECVSELHVLSTIKAHAITFRSRQRPRSLRCSRHCRFRRDRTPNPTTSFRASSWPTNSERMWSCLTGTTTSIHRPAL